MNFKNELQLLISREIRKNHNETLIRIYRTFKQIIDENIMNRELVETDNENDDVATEDAVSSNVSEITEENTSYDKEPEVWKLSSLIENNERIYVSNYGNLKRHLNNGQWKDIKPSIEHVNKNYARKYIHVTNQGYRRMYRIATLVAHEFIGTKPNKSLVVDHFDRNPLNNFYKNLQYISQRENLQRKKK